MRQFSSLVFALVFACSPDIDVDDGEGVDDLPNLDGPTVEFDPAAQVIPFPNNLLLETGLVALPEQCGESPAETALREGVLNTLDGFGTFKPPPFTVTFTEPVAAASLEGRVLLFRRATGTEPADPAVAEPVPVMVVPAVTERFSADCSESTPVDTVAIAPLVPLDGQSTYVVALTQGITTESGAPFLPSVTWVFTRSAENPVTVEEEMIVAERTPLDPVEDADQLRGIDRLWRAHASALAFLDQALGVDRSQILIAWEFSTQTTTAPLDPGVGGSLAEKAPADPPAGIQVLASGEPAVTSLIESQLPDACDQLPCDQVSAVLAVGLSAPDYQVRLENPLGGGDPIPGPWADPIAPPEVDTEILDVLVFLPDEAAPADGYPTVIFGHGLTRSQGDLLAIGSQLAAAGIASVAMNWVAHGNRAVQISNQAPDCAGEPDPTDPNAVQCFAPILSSDLAATRDSLRQSALDVLTLVKALKACDGDRCGNLHVDPERLGYLGQSLGSIIGTLVVAMSSDIRTAVLNVGGVGLIDVLEHTDSLEIRCSLVDALIAAGVIEGEPADTCLGDEWKEQPGYQQFARIARWVLDPADGANYLSRFGDRPILIQEIIGDAVVPNFVTEQMAALRGLSPLVADPATMSPTPPSEAITSQPMAPKWVTYASLPADPSTSFPGNTYGHGSLLEPADGNDAGALATSLMQTDAITYLFQNLQ